MTTMPQEFLSQNKNELHHKVAADQKHNNPNQRQDLQNVLAN